MQSSPAKPTEGHGVQTPLPTLTGWEDDISLQRSPAAADGVRDSKVGSDWPEYIDDGSESTSKTKEKEETANGSQTESQLPALMAFCHDENTLRGAGCKLQSDRGHAALDLRADGSQYKIRPGVRRQEFEATPTPSSSQLPDNSSAGIPIMPSPGVRLGIVLECEMVVCGDPLRLATSAP
ncbi:uncharacterized protein N7496_004664 [Penicillium cataractarum]|uniref:Uncharacterized protein n=1 Tax=Penicillium cataractarum TaxID=2100454 RepID=A0A9W9SF39_9EURO|nr:uncharacterized protein N7496_004664 [Penicillium cataractarum]KAJ5377255.1 hypothetical protein N7496_004664 [Penicillium cataractarum]